MDLLRPQVDVIVLVSHLGFGFDKRIAEEISGIDCILGAHTHHLLEQAVFVGSTLIGAAGKSGNHLGVIELEFNLDRRERTRIVGYTVDVTSRPNSLRIAKIIEKFQQSSHEVLNEQVAYLNEPLSNDWYTESELGNLLAEGIREWTNSEVGIVNAGQILDSISSGKLTQEQLLTICPSPINPCSTFLSGQHICQALEEALLTEFKDKVIRGFGFRGKVLGTLCLNGIEVIYNESYPPYNKIVSVKINHECLDVHRIYKVGTIDMFTFGIGYPSLSKGQDTHYYLPEFIRDVLKHQLHNQDAIARSRLQQWKMVSGSSI